MTKELFQLLGTQVVTTIIGMAFVSFRRKPQELPIPSFAQGGLSLFLKVLAPTYLCALLFGFVFMMAGVSQERTSAFAHVVMPSVCAFYITKLLLQQK
jgi:hypothetical protein